MLAYDDRTQFYGRPLPPPRLPGLPGDVPGPSLTGGLPGGCGSTPLPTPLFPRGLPPPDEAIAGDASDVDSNTVIAGGTVSEYLPQPFRKARRSLAIFVGVVVLISSMARSSTCAIGTRIQRLIPTNDKRSGAQTDPSILNSRVFAAAMSTALRRVSRKIRY